MENIYKYIYLVVIIAILAIIIALLIELSKTKKSITTIRNHSEKTKQKASILEEKVNSIEQTLDNSLVPEAIGTVAALSNIRNIIKKDKKKRKKALKKMSKKIRKGVFSLIK